MPTPKKGYRISGKKVPSVTTILGDDVGGLLWRAENGAAMATEAVGGDALTGMSEWRAQKKDTMDAGSYAHWLIESYLGKESVAPDVTLIAEERGQIAFEHWQDWWAAVGPTVDVLHIEEQVTCGAWSYGGTPDLVVRGPSGVWVYDWKTSETPKLRAKSVAQCAAYMLAVLETYGYADPAGLRIVGMPTVKDGELRDWPIMWDALGDSAAMAFTTRRLAHDAWKSLERLTKAVAEPK